MTADVHTLAGAYAVDALPPDERAFFERHLEVCDTCAQEVVELTETAASLGRVVAETPPAHLRDRLLADIDRTRQLPPLPSQRPETSSQTWRERLRPVLAPVAAVLAVAVLGLSYVAADLNQRLRSAEQGLVADGDVAAVLAAADATALDIEVESGGFARFHYSPSLDRAVLVTNGLPATATDEVYELWLFHDGEPVPAGVLAVDESGRASSVVEGSVTGAEMLAVTVEPAPGVPEPTGPVVFSRTF